MLTLPIMKKWYDLILSGEKKEEYREIKPYYDKRLPKQFGMIMQDGKLIKLDTILPSTLSTVQIKFVNGYGNSRPYFVALCSLKISTGKVEWGAKQGKEYYVLRILEIEKVQE